MKTAHRIREVLTEHIEDPEAFWNAVRESLESAGPSTHIFRVPRIDRWFARLATRVRGEDGEPLGLLVLMRDVTAERAAAREASITRQVIEASPDGIMLLDPESHALMTNRRMDELMTEILGSPTSDGRVHRRPTTGRSASRPAWRIRSASCASSASSRQDPTAHPDGRVPRRGDGLDLPALRAAHLRARTARRSARCGCCAT